MDQTFLVQTFLLNCRMLHHSYHLLLPVDEDCYAACPQDMGLYQPLQRLVLPCMLGHLVVLPP